MVTCALQDPAWSLQQGGTARQRRPDGAPAHDRDEKSWRGHPVRCRPCGAVIGDAADLFRPGEGDAQVYFNPYGIVHEVVTLRRTRGVVTEGEPTTEFTWFRGYAWRVGYCARCGAHLGWHYEAVASAAAPPHFWGLRRSEIIVSDEGSASGA